MFHHYVVLCELGQPLELAEPGLANALGISAYDARVRFGGPMPRVAFQSVEKGPALAAQHSLEQLGHRVLLCSTSDVTPLDRLVQMHRFTFQGDLLFANDQAPPSHPVRDLVSMLHLKVEARVQRSSKEMEWVRMGRAHGRIEVEKRRHEGHSEEALVLLWKQGPMWVLRMSEGRYLGLGPDLRSTQHDNFEATIARLRRVAPAARYDDRFLRNPISAQAEIAVRDNDAATMRGDAGLDVVVHAWGQHSLLGQGGPYRVAQRPSE